ncbi:hypothetical protein V5O48_018551 [Marasmius crinis-equi]|uniref:Uncharacterized protein n=1 Tax=Marasmius crinis-equi TaxID=585013 RepID=A0ABR3EKU6_9AGAR
MDKKAGAARNSDIYRLTSAIANWLNGASVFDYLGDHLIPSDAGTLYIDPDSRSGRGFYNFVTGRLLTGIDPKFDWDNPIVRDGIRNLETEYDSIATYFWIRAFYASYKGDPNNLKDGYLKSILLVKTYKHIFTSKASATHYTGPENVDPARKRQRCKGQTTQSTRDPVATLIGMNEVTARSIAYAAVILHFCLNNASKWTIVHDGFSYISLYDSITSGNAFPPT